MLSPTSFALVLALVSTTASAFDPGTPTTASGRAFAVELGPAIAHAAVAYRPASEAAQALSAEIGRVELLLILRDREHIRVATTALIDHFAHAMDLLDVAREAQTALADVDSRLHARGWGFGGRVFAHTATPAERDEAIDLGELESKMVGDPEFKEVSVGVDGLVIGYMDTSTRILSIVQRAKALLDGRTLPPRPPMTAEERAALLNKISEL